MRAGFAVTPDIVARYFAGRRPADMFDGGGDRRRPQAAGRLCRRASAARSLRRFRAELRATKHAAQALAWLRGPKCVASSSSYDRIRLSLECTGLIRFFEPNLFSASEVKNGKPAPDLFLHAAAKHARAAGRLHRGGGFRRRRRRRRCRRHDGDRLHRRQPRRAAGSTITCAGPAPAW